MLAVSEISALADEHAASPLSEIFLVLCLSQLQNVTRCL
jgi:hypothetical protein